MNTRRDRSPDEGDFVSKCFGMVFDRPVGVEECRLAGRKLGGAWSGARRIEFEQALVTSLGSLGAALRTDDKDFDQAIAAFDQAAWTAWEAGAKREARGGSDAFDSIARPSDE